MNSKVKRVICLSHSKDVDGLCSAAIVKMVQGGETVLSDYNDLIEKLAEIDDVEKLYVCDLGLNHKNQDDFLRHMSRLSKKGEVEYIDHHPLAEEFKEKIESAGVKLTHSTEESCSILVFKRFQHEVSKITSMIAAFGAIGDFMDFRPIASEIIEGFDRLFLLFETTVLSHAIAKKNKDRDTLVEFVTRLSEGELPHMMNKVIEYAAQHASTVSEIMIQVQKNGKTMKNLSFIRTDQGPLGSVASLLLGAFGLSVGIALKSEALKVHSL